MYDLSDCTEYRQTLLARPPRVIRATVLLLGALVASGVFWAALTEADLVVRAAGRIRPMTQSIQQPNAAGEESEVSSLRGGRIVAVHIKEGGRVQQGDVLICLNSEQLDNDTAKQQQFIAAAEQELEQLNERQALLNQRFETARAKAMAEWNLAEKELDKARQTRDAEIRLSQVALDLAEMEDARAKKLADRGVVTDAERLEVQARYAEAQLKLQQAQLPIDDGQLHVLKQALELVDREHALKCTGLKSEVQAKQSELAAARLELAHLKWHQSQSVLQAPSDGTVTSLDVAVGDVVEAGQPVAVVVDQCGFRIDVTVTSDDVGHLREGMKARVKLDAFDFQKYGCIAGRVVFIAPDSQFATDRSMPPAYTVKIALDNEAVGRGNRRGHVKLGMTGTVEIMTDNESILSLLVRSIRQGVSLG